jgi:hypothetical protein
MFAMVGQVNTRDRRVILSTLWIFVMFNYIYADILKLFFNPSLHKEATQRLAAGYEGSIHITQGFVLFAAVVLETAIAMVLLSRVLGYRANRWANMVIGGLQALTIAFTLSGGALNLFYVMFAVIEIAATVFIVWYAWTWRPTPVTQGQDSQLPRNRI